jgi:molybdopterin converting factor subunit 1
MNKVKLLFFATLKENAGTSQADLDIPSELTVREFKEKMFVTYPNLPKTKANLVIAINGEFAFDNEKIPLGAEIALFPPVSGG